MTAPPTFSVIIPARNCAGTLTRCLEALQRSEFRDFECIVVDDASTEPLESIVARYDAQPIRLDPRGGPARARNRGAARARGEVLVFIDADVCVHADTLRRFDEHFSAHPLTDAVMGSYDDTPTDPGFVSQFKNLFHHYIHHHSRHDAQTFWASCGAIRQSIFTEVGGFDEQYTRPCIEDIELGARVRACGHRIDLNPTIQVTHLKRWTLASLVRTDVFDRAIPWLLLMLRQSTIPADLNATVRHRVSIALIWGWLGLAILMPFVGGRSAVVPSLVVAATLLLALNIDLYRFFARERGLLFAVRAVPLHWLYYAYCGVAVGIAVFFHLRERFF